MARFKTRLIMRPTKRGRSWVLEFPLVYESDLAGTIEVPVGFECDLNSLPQPFWVLSPPTDFPEAGVVHDWLYRYKLVPRKLADQVYREALGVLGAGRRRQFIRYWGVRLGGRKAYAKPAEEPR